MIKLRPGFAPAASCLVISTILLTLPGSSFPKEDWLSRIWFDKWVHLGMFFILVVLWCWGSQSIWKQKDQLKKVFCWIAGGCLIYGVAMEFVQLHLVKNRSFDTGDIIADAAGCAAGLYYSWRRYIKK